MENIVINAFYLLGLLIILGLIILIIYGLIVVINLFIDDYKDGMFWFSPKE
ncbi:MAG: hypothetical protein L3J56_04265 [Bacteroidales bacterium]|nr:hypothetical protein [Bacteroidales bacterium]